MKLTKDRFHNSTVTKEYVTLGRPTRCVFGRYTYESTGNLYGVDVRTSDGDKTYHVNCGFATEPNKYHRAIEQHFGI